MTLLPTHKKIKDNLYKFCSCEDIWNQACNSGVDHVYTYTLGKSICNSTKSRKSCMSASDCSEINKTSVK
jgi:hypothetical protein